MEYDVIELIRELSGRSESVQTPPPTVPLPSQIPDPDDLPSDWRIEWEERAAIMEYDGGLPRERAEALALTDIVTQMKNEKMQKMKRE